VPRSSTDPDANPTDEAFWEEAREVMPRQRETVTMRLGSEMSQWRRQVAGIAPGVERHPVKRLEPDQAGLLRPRHRWRDDAERSGRQVNRSRATAKRGRRREA
jgi:hypothetical protein